MLTWGTNIEIYILFCGANVGNDTLNNEVSSISQNSSETHILHKNPGKPEKQPERDGVSQHIDSLQILTDCVDFAYIQSHFVDVGIVQENFSSITP